MTNSPKKAKRGKAPTKSSFSKQLNLIGTSKQTSFSSPPIQYRTLVGALFRKIQNKGFNQEDKRLKRITRALPGDFLVVPDAVLKYLREESPLQKYYDDWMRMEKSFKLAIKNAKADKDSRRLVVFNDQNFDKVYQCFTHLQFVMTHRGEFDLYVYQRSADMIKLHDDLVFFANAGRVFEDYVKIPVSKLVVVYGSIHYEISQK